MSTPTTLRRAEDIRPLTGIRGVAAFFVVLYHLHYNPNFTALPLGFFDRAYLSVDIFYVLSGFILTLRYQNWFAENLRWPVVAAFIGQRISRIYPAYFVASLVYYVRWLINLNGQHMVEFQTGDIIANIFLLQGWGIHVPAICGTTGSVSGEMFAYLLFPFLIGFLAFGGRWRYAFVTIAAVGGIIAVASSQDGIHGTLDVVSQDNFFLLLRCVSEFALGVVAYALAHHSPWLKILRHDAAVPALLLALFVIVVMGLPDLLFVALLPFLMIGLFANGRTANMLFGKGPVHQLGVISYSLYLVHLLMIDIAAHVMKMTESRYGMANPLAFALLALAASLLAATLLQRLVEVPGRRLLQKYLPSAKV